MRLTDLRDGRLYIDEQVILLAPQVGVRLAAYLKYRSSTYMYSSITRSPRALPRRLTNG
jgi:hypothetical protein